MFKPPCNPKTNRWIKTKAERSLAQLLASGRTPKQMDAALPGIHRTIEKATQEVTAAKKALKPIPAKIPASELNPDAKLARHLLHQGGTINYRASRSPSPPTGPTAPT